MKTMRDSNGQDVPVKYVGKYDKLRDRQAHRILARFRTARAMLEKLVKESIDDLDVLRKTKEKLGDKGNFSAQSFDGLVMVEIRQQYNIRLDERVARARELMLEYVGGIIERIGGDDAKALKLIINEAFRANDKGILSTSKILALLRMEIRDSRWSEAKQILQDSIKPQKGKRYLNCLVRSSTQKDFAAIRLDIADCWPEEPASN